MSKSPFESALQDRAAVADLKNLGFVPAAGLGRRPVIPVEHLHEAVDALAAAPGAGMRARLLEASAPPGPARAAEYELEAIILATIRPTLLVSGQTYAPPKLPEWQIRLAPLQSVIEPTLASVGRIEIKGPSDDRHLGTGWLVAEDVIVTNRHVAKLFTSGVRRAALIDTDFFGRRVPVQLDFREEYGNRLAAEHAIVEVLWVEDFDAALPDIALMKIARGDFLPPPLELQEALPALDRGVVGVIGYPAYDQRNDPSLMLDYFRGIYDVKRFAPGYVTGTDGFLFHHDCTTLGGSSGSAVIDAATGKAIGLHFAGTPEINNYAVQAKEILARLRRLEVRVPVPRDIDRVRDRVPFEEVRPSAASYADRRGFDPAFVSGTPAFVPGMDGLADDLTMLADGASELKYHHFSVWMSRGRRLALCTAVNIDGSRLRRIPRPRDRWLLDPRIDETLQIGNELYRRNRLDRGHLVRRLDPVWGDEAQARAAMEDTFHYTNAAPQHEGLNQHTWLELEDYILDNAGAHELRVSVFTGPVFSATDNPYREVPLPEEFWKVIVMARRGAAGGILPHLTAYLLSQRDLLGNLEFAFGEFRTWQVPVRTIEQRTGLDFAALRAFDPLETSGLEAAARPLPIRGWRDIVLASGGGGPAPAAGIGALGERLRTAQRRAPSMDFVAEFDGPPPADLQARLPEALAGVQLLTEPLFAGDPRFLRLRLPGVSTETSGINPFDLVPELAAALGACSLEPDLEQGFSPERPEPLPRPGPGIESAGVPGCWVGDSEPAPGDAAWALRNLRVPEAWALSEQAGRPGRGAGVLIGQPDTGVLAPPGHPELEGTVDTSRWKDLFTGGGAVDPLVRNDPLDTPGHGTGTGSVVISRGSLMPDALGRVTGPASAGTLVPIRCIESVVRFTQSRVAQAVEYAVDAGCHVITMSLGGIFSRALSAAVEHAVDNNVIVLAAAGNCARLVVWPARYDLCIAVGGSNVHDRTWKGSSRGDSVDFCAPAQHVMRATHEPDASGLLGSAPGEGTSFAVALAAGVAACWLAHHGRDALIASLAPGERLQHRFRRLARDTARVPEAGWDTGNYGAGILDAAALLGAGAGSRAGGPEAAESAHGTAPGASAADAARELLADAMTGLGGEEGTFTVDPALLDAHGLELMLLILRRQLAPGRPALEGIARRPASAALSAALSQPENAGLARLLDLA